MSKDGFACESPSTPCVIQTCWVKPTTDLSTYIFVCSAAAWDTVEELSAAASHAKDNAQKEDPLEKFCEDDPSADECRVYED